MIIYISKNIEELKAIQSEQQLEVAAAASAAAAAATSTQMEVGVTIASNNEGTIAANQRRRTFFQELQNAANKVLLVMNVLRRQHYLLYVGTTFCVICGSAIDLFRR